MLSHYLYLDQGRREKVLLLMQLESTNEWVKSKSKDIREHVVEVGKGNEYI